MIKALTCTFRVELRGLEPLTPTLPVWCATSCATAPCGRSPYRFVVSGRPVGRRCADVVSTLRWAQDLQSDAVPLQAPAPLGLHENRPAGVAERREPPPVSVPELQQGPDGPSGGAAVGHGQHRPLRGKQGQDARGGSGARLGVGLPTTASYVFASPPGSMLVREADGGLLRSEPLPLAEVQLTQALVYVQPAFGRLGDDNGGVPGPLEVTRDDHGRPVVGERVRERGRLPPSGLVQLDIELALDAAVGVVGGASMPEQDDASGQRVARWAPRSASASTKGMTGQSFQSRSRA